MTHQAKQTTRIFRSDDGEVYRYTTEMRTVRKVHPRHGVVKVRYPHVVELRQWVGTTVPVQDSPDWEPCDDSEVWELIQSVEQCGGRVAS